VFMPFVVGGQTIALAQHRGLRGRRWVLALWAAGTLLLPILLELTGVLPRTWRISDVGELVTWSNALVSTSSFGIAALIAGQTLLGMVLASFSIEIAKARTTAQTAAFVQAWHLRQMLPRGTSQLP